MPANLTAPYKNAEKIFREARSAEEKILALEEMLRVIPKHKGTEKLQAGLKTRLAKLRREGEKKVGGKRASHHIPSQGAGQATLVGAPNVGKSALLGAVSKAKPEVAAYPMTTHQPVPGMMDYEDAQIQLIDLPPITSEHVEPWVYDIVRGSDLVLILSDLTAVDPLGQVDLVREQLEAKRIYLARTGDDSAAESPTDLPSELPLGSVIKPALLIGTKLDGEKADDNAAFLAEYFESRFRCLALSAEADLNLGEFRQTLFEALDVLRVYTKTPGKKTERDAPYVLPRGSTIFDVATMVHKDVAARLKFARIWGSGAFDGQKVNRDHPVQDGDLVELHITGA